MTAFDYALAYWRAGLSVIPARADGTKAPDVPRWEPYMERRASEEELRRWFLGGPERGVIVVCGHVSRNLEVLDFDHEATFLAWRKAVLGAAPLALEGIPVVRTPAGGRHLYLFREMAGPNRKLARRKADRKTLIEVKGERGYVLAPGCPPACHPTGRTYEWEVPLPGLASAGLRVGA